MTVTRAGFRFCIGESVHLVRVLLLATEFCRPHRFLDALALTSVLRHTGNPLFSIQSQPDKRAAVKAA